MTSFKPHAPGRVADAFAPPPKVHRETSMKFTTIRWDGEAVGLKWEEQIAGAIDKHEWSCAEKPTPQFLAALGAFGPYVIDLIDAPPDWEGELEIRQLSLKEEDSGARGVVVTALRKCARAKQRTLLLNSPYMSAPPKDHNGNADGYLDQETLKLIEELEVLAAKFKLGEREQGVLPLEDNGSASPKRNGGAKAKGRPKKDKSHVPGVGTVFNPDATEPLTDELLRQLLLSVERDVPIDAIAQFTSSERQQAQTWATARQKELIDALKPDEKVPSEPPVLLRSATPALIGVPPEKKAPAKKGKQGKKG